MCANQPAASKATPASCMVRLASLTAPAQTARACRNRIRTPEKHMPDPLRTGVHTYLASCNRLRHHGGDGNRGVRHADPSTTERRAALRASLPAPPRILVAAPCSASLAHTIYLTLPWWEVTQLAGWLEVRFLLGSPELYEPSSSSKVRCWPRLPRTQCPCRVRAPALRVPVWTP